MTHFAYRQPKKQFMGEGLSLYLDLVRLTAALVVVVYHAGQERISGGWIKLPMLGNDAVMVFFVLSGFVIAYSVEKKKETLGRYAANRFSRLWSVLVPAIVFTLILDHIGLHFFPTFYEHWAAYEPEYPWTHQVWGVVAAVTFTCQLWFTSSETLSNGPVWSLGFEFWYYAIFGAWVYLRSAPRWIALAICILISGPKILILMPIWLLGVAAFKWLQVNRLSAVWGWCALIVPLVLHVIVKFFRPYEHTAEFGTHLFGPGYVDKLGVAQWFPYCYLIGALVAIHFIGADAVQETLRSWLGRFSSLIRNAAQHTLSIYLFHFPILLFVTAGLSSLHPGPVRTILGFIITLSGCFALGSIFENTRFAWRNWLEKLPLLFRPVHPDNPSVQSLNSKADV
jgi:peptidoglycan/LPS O-acetylase OafA/YrhL